MNVRADPVATSLLQRLPHSPDAYPQKLDVVGEQVLLVQFDAALYRTASFLDDRILSPSTKGAWISLDQAAEAARSVSSDLPLHFIFHTGHVGSTLVSRLLDETGEMLSLREPLPLRTLADAADALGRPDSLLSEPQFEALVGMFLRLWRRGYAGSRGIVLKATSSAGRLALPLLAAESSRAIYMNLRAEPYLATLLAGQNSPTDLRGHGPGRMRRLQARVGAKLSPLHALSLGELAAMSWLAESWSQCDALDGSGGRVISIDFELFLARVEETMGRILDHFALTASGSYLAGVGRSPVLTRYSKAPEYAYTPGERAQVLNESRRFNGAEIRKGLQWLEQRALSDAAVAKLLDRVGS